MNFSSLYFNLHNIYCHLDQGYELVSDDKGRSLYTHGIQKRYFYDFYHIAHGEENKRMLTDKAIAETFRSFQQLMKADLNEDELLNYLTYMKPFVHKILIPNRDLFCRFFDERGFKGSEAFSALEACDADIQERAQIKTFEAMTGRPIPLEQLRSLSENRYSLDLENWIEHLNKRFLKKPTLWERWVEGREQVTGLDLHRVIKILSKKWGFSPDHVIFRLRELGNKLFEAPDPKFLAIRRRWALCGEIRWEGACTPIGKRKATQKEDPWNFPLSASPHFVLVAKNTASLALNRIYYQSFLDLQKDPLPIDYIQPEKSYCGVEVYPNFAFTLAAPPWDEPNWTDYADTLAAYFRYLIDHNLIDDRWPEHSIGWSRGRLCTAEALIITPGNFIRHTLNLLKVMKALYHFSGKHKKVYRYLYRKLGIKHEPEVEYIHRIFDRLAKGDEIVFHKIIREPTSLLSRVKILRSEHWLRPLSHTFSSEILKLVEKPEDIERLHRLYTKNKGFGFFDPEWLEDEDDISESSEEEAEGTEGEKGSDSWWPF